MKSHKKNKGAKELPAARFGRVQREISKMMEAEKVDVLNAINILDTLKNGYLLNYVSNVAAATEALGIKVAMQEEDKDPVVSAEIEKVKEELEKGSPGTPSQNGGPQTGGGIDIDGKPEL